MSQSTCTKAQGETGLPEIWLLCRSSHGVEGYSLINSTNIAQWRMNKMKKLLEKTNKLLNEACEIITLLEDISGISKYGYSDNSIETKVNTFFKKIVKMNEEKCYKCDQYPYSETDKHCPVCYDRIGD